MALRPLRPTLAPTAAKAKPRPPRAGMNGTEKRYATYLDGQVLLGKVRGWGFQRITLRLGDDCRYTPDFDVQVADGTLEFHEVKGFWRDDARVKIRVAADRYPWYAFKAITAGKTPGTGWEIEAFEPTRGSGDHPRVPDTLFAVSG